ncbi:T9SS type A sorting domain-containing protein, partial [Sediminicola luteus]
VEQEACPMNSGLAVLPRDQEVGYQPGTEIEACIGDDFHIWMYMQLEALGDPSAEDYSQWMFTFTLPNGQEVVQADPENVQNNLYCKENIDKTDFGTYKISWKTPEGCTGESSVTLTLSGDCESDKNTNATGATSLYPNPAKSNSVVTLSLNTPSKGSQTGKGLTAGGEKLWLSIYSIDGRMVSPARSYQVYQGESEVQFNTLNLAPGKYIVRVIGNGWIDSKHLIVR